MKKFLKKLILFSVAASLVASMCSCGSKKNAVTEDNPDKEATLKMIVGGTGMQTDTQLVVEEVNKLLADRLPNTKLDLEVIPSSDYAQKWQLIAGANETVDIAWHGWMIDYVSEVKKGAYMAIDELVDLYGANIKADIPGWMLDNLKVDGKLYAIPCNQLSVTKPISLRTFKDLSDEYLDEAALVKALEENTQAPGGSTPLSDAAFTVIDDYFAKLKNAGKFQKGLDPTSMDWFAEINNYSSVELETTYVTFDENGKPTVNDSYALDAPDNFYRWAQDFYKKGYIRNDVLTAQNLSASIGPDGYAAWITSYDGMCEEIESKRYNIGIKAIPFSKEYIQPISASATNITIPRTSANPVRAMKFINILNDSKDPAVLNTLTYGIEGKHYEKTGENTIKTLAYESTPQLDSAYGNYAWIFGNVFNVYYTQNDNPAYNEYSVTLNNNAVAHKLAGFRINTAPIKTELAQIASVKSEFKGLRYGAHPDYKTALKEYREKIQACGQQKIITELQKQLDEWYENKNK